jgi:NAD-dependent SIR2 family protein deacetylase
VNNQKNSIQFDKQVNSVAHAIVKSNYLVAFTGAGISTESGISDFRGPNGVWTRRDKGLPPLPPKKPRSEIKPNVGHYALLTFQQRGLLKFLISQNTDNLHLASGFPPHLIAELHGNGTLMKCITCDSRFHKKDVGWNDSIHGKGYSTSAPTTNQPRCSKCNNRLISSIVNFNDPMPLKEMKETEQHTHQCDTMLVVGSSLVVTPAADFPKIAKLNGAKLIIINIGETPLDNMADIRIEEKTGIFLEAVEEKVLQLLKEGT